MDDYEYERIPMKTRKPNWSETEKIVLVQEYEKRKRILRPQLPAMVTSRQKHDAWNEIADMVNTHNPHVKRSVKDVRKKWQNMACHMKAEMAKQIQESATSPDGSANMLSADPATIYKTILDIFGEESLTRWNVQGHGTQGRAPPTAADDQTEDDRNSEDDDSEDDEEFDEEGSLGLSAVVNDSNNDRVLRNVPEQTRTEIRVKQEVVDKECESVVGVMESLINDVTEAGNSNVMEETSSSNESETVNTTSARKPACPALNRENSHPNGASESPCTKMSPSTKTENYPRGQAVLSVPRGHAASNILKRQVCENMNSSNFVQRHFTQNSAGVESGVPRHSYDFPHFSPKPADVFQAPPSKRLKATSDTASFDAEIRLLQKQVLELEKQRLITEVQKTEMEKEKLSIEKEKLYLEKEKLLLEKEKLHLEVQQLRDVRRNSFMQ